ncbi:MAG: hypothetical protein ATN35_00520 [Epulopiscium sp. Nele67-Bin004]|nr:MAG: hypothetical protein ATN35_00520 [Epulopiscium sp. Nele67-Bin004]
MTQILIFVIMFATIVVVHEWGHFIAAKKMDVQVNEFAIGMGPKLWSKQKGETLYTLRLLPIGGFCAMEGENEESTNERALCAKSPAQRMIIFVAGAFMNFILTWVLLSLFISYQGYNTNVVSSLLENSPIAQAGVQPGETIVSINGVQVETQQEILEQVTTPDIPYSVVIQAIDGQTRTLQIVAAAREGGGAALGFYPTTQRLGIISSIGTGLTGTFQMIGDVFSGFANIITGMVGVDELAGIVGVTQVTTEVWENSVDYSLMYAIMNMVYITAVLSANLAVLNLIPFPALDGGRILFTFIELVRGKPLDQNKEGFIHFVGFALLMVLMVVVLYNDIVRLMA